MRQSAIFLLGGALALSFSSAALADPVTLEASLSGANQTGPGDPDGSGKFTAEIDVESGDVCYILNVSKIGKAVAAHVHKGAAGKNGRPVFTIEVTGVDEDLCIAQEPDKLRPIVEVPGNFYVNVHTADFPKGAIRGQLEGEGIPAPDAQDDVAAAPADEESAADESAAAVEAAAE